MKAGLSSLGVAGMALAAVLCIVHLSLATESNIPMPSPQAVLVLKDPELQKEYGEAANRYVEIGKRDLIEKWDTRDTWREDGA
jgi:photosystem II stability/assembly factor-like uncharacterized protein